MGDLDWDDERKRFSGTDENVAIKGFEWRGKVQQWRSVKPYGITSFDIRPLYQNDHFGLLVVYEW